MFSIKSVFIFIVHKIVQDKMYEPKIDPTKNMIEIILNHTSPNCVHFLLPSLFWFLLQYSINLTFLKS